MKAVASVIITFLAICGFLGMINLTADTGMPVSVLAAGDASVDDKVILTVNNDYKKVLSNQKGCDDAIFDLSKILATDRKLSFNAGAVFVIGSEKAGREVFSVSNFSEEKITVSLKGDGAIKLMNSGVKLLSAELRPGDEAAFYFTIDTSKIGLDGSSDITDISTVLQIRSVL